MCLLPDSLWLEPQPLLDQLAASVGWVNCCCCCCCWTNCSCWKNCPCWMNCPCLCHRLGRTGLLRAVTLAPARLSCLARVSALPALYLRATPGALVWHPKLPPSSLHQSPEPHHQHHQMAAHLQLRALDLELPKVARESGHAGSCAGPQSHRADTCRLLAAWPWHSHIFQKETKSTNWSGRV